MTPDSIGIVVVARMALGIGGHGFFNWLCLSYLVDVFNIILRTRDSIGIVFVFPLALSIGGHDFALFGILYQSCLLLFNIWFRTVHSNGFLLWHRWR